MASFTYSAGAGDCWGSGSDGFFNTGTFMYIGNTITPGAHAITWIPFVIADIPQGTVISSATVRWVATEDRAENTANIHLGCEAADNPSAPGNFASLDARVLTTAFYSYNLEAYTTGVEYSYDVTNAVQEIINRSGWAIGNTLAIYSRGDATSSDKRRRIATVENTTYVEAKLDIVADSFIPRMIGLL